LKSPFNFGTPISIKLSSAFPKEDIDLSYLDTYFEVQDAHRAKSCGNQITWWTGKSPLDCPGVRSDGNVYSLPQLCLSNSSVKVFYRYILPLS